jgi:hypothetical protein
MFNLFKNNHNILEAKNKLVSIIDNFKYIIFIKMFDY